jgi:hypothetical protein
MRCIALYKKVAYDTVKDGISVYHARFFHGQFVNTVVDDNNLGDALQTRLLLEKNAYECRYIFQPQRNLVIPDSARKRLLNIRNIAFFQVSFTKLFFCPYRKGDQSLGPDDFREFKQWLSSFRHDEKLRQEIENFYELILPSHVRLMKEYPAATPVAFNLEPWRNAHLNLSSEMLERYPGIWSSEGIVLREDVFKLIEEFFCWDYFNRVQFNVDQ